MNRVKREPIYERVLVGWRVTCLTCGTIFESKLKKATYCSDNCRVTAWLRKERKTQAR